MKRWWIRKFHMSRCEYCGRQTHHKYAVSVMTCGLSPSLFYICPHCANTNSLAYGIVSEAFDMFDEDIYIELVTKENEAYENRIKQRRAKRNMLSTYSKEMADSITIDGMKRLRLAMEIIDTDPFFKDRYTPHDFWKPSPYELKNGKI